MLVKGYCVSGHAWMWSSSSESALNLQIVSSRDPTTQGQGQARDNVPVGKGKLYLFQTEEQILTGELLLVTACSFAMREKTKGLAQAYFLPDF